MSSSSTYGRSAGCIECRCLHSSSASASPSPSAPSTSTTTTLHPTVGGSDLGGSTSGWFGKRTHQRHWRRRRRTRRRWRRWRRRRLTDTVFEPVHEHRLARTGIPDDKHPEAAEHVVVVELVRQARAPRARPTCHGRRLALQVGSVLEPRRAAEGATRSEIENSKIFMAPVPTDLDEIR